MASTDEPDSGGHLDVAAGCMPKDLMRVNSPCTETASIVSSDSAPRPRAIQRRNSWTQQASKWMGLSLLSSEGSGESRFRRLSFDWTAVTRSMTSTRSRNAPKELSGNRARVSAMVNSRTFDLMMCAIVVANSVLIGLEQSWRMDNRETLIFDYLEHAFLVFYIVELMLRFYEARLSCMYNNWVRFDAAIVFTGILTNWVLVPIFGQLDRMGSLQVLKMARLLRLARMLKLVVRCRELLMLVQGLLNSVSTMFYTVVLCCIILYVLGCMSMELIPLAMQSSEDMDPALRDIIDSNFNSLPMAMLSLVQFITFDNVVYIYKPLIEADATLAIFFMAVILVVGVVFMNLVTAVIVNSGLEQAMQDKDIQKAMVESKRKKLIANLKEAFYRADADESGEITRDEIAAVSGEDKELLKKVLGVDDLCEIFDSLDVDGDGELGIEEFCQGIERIVSNETSVEFKRMERLLTAMHKQLKESQKAQDDLRHSIAEALGNIQTQFPLEPPADGVPEVPEQTIVRPMPRWADQLIVELKEVFTADVRRAMDEACASFMAQVCDGVMTRPTTPWVSDVVSDCSSANPPWAHDAGSPRTVATAQKVGTWEVLPPVGELRSPKSTPRPQHKLQSAPPRTASSDHGGEGQQIPSAPHVASSRPRRSEGQGPRASPRSGQVPALGGFVPESGRPTLLSAGRATEASAGNMPNLSSLRREEL